MSASLESPREFAIYAVQQSGHHLNRPDLKEFRGDKEIALLAVQTNGGALSYCSKELQDDKEIVMASLASSVKSHWSFEQLSHVSPRLLADREVAQYVLYNSRQDHLQHFSEDIRADKNLIVASNTSIRYASEEIKADRAVVAAAVVYRANDLEWANDTFKDDKEIVLSSVSQSGYMLEHASAKLKDDAEVVMTAVKGCPSALEHASPRLRNNLEIVLEAVRQDEETGEYASKYIKKLIGDGDPVEVLTKAFQSEKLAAKLAAQLRPKPEQLQRKMKI